MTLPTLVVVSGPPGSGKTTLAHQIAPALGCPAICRDEIKEGMVHANPGFVPSPGDPLTMRTLTTFFEVVGLLIRSGVTVVAEAAFQDRLWRPGLEPLTDLATIRIVHCLVDADVAHNRIARRSSENPRRAAHTDQLVAERRIMSHDSFAQISLPVPTLQVNTTNGYNPGVGEIVEFIGRD